jgi:hypothetical protein
MYTYIYICIYFMNIGSSPLKYNHSFSDDADVCSPHRLTNCLLCALRLAGGGLAGSLARSGVVGSGLASSGLTSSGLTSGGLTSGGKDEKRGLSGPVSSLLEKYSLHPYSANSYASTNTNLSANSYLTNPNLLANSYSATNTNLLANSYSSTYKPSEQSHSYTSINPTYTEPTQFQYKDLAELKKEALKEKEVQNAENDRYSPVKKNKNLEYDIFSDNKYKDLFRINNDTNVAKSFDYTVPKSIDYNVPKSGNPYVLPALKKTENTSKYPEKYPENISKYSDNVSKYTHDEDEGYQLGGMFIFLYM